MKLASSNKVGLDAWVVGLILLGALLAVGVLDVYQLKLLGKVLIFWLIALGLQLLVAQAGVISLGHAAFMATGAYIAGLFSLQGQHDLILMLACVAVACAAFGSLMGALILRTQGLYQLMATLAIAQMAYYGFQSLRSLGGDDGFAVSNRPSVLGLITLNTDVKLLLAIIVILVLGLYVAHRIRRSEMGALMLAVRDDGRRVASLGISPYGVKVWAFLISAVFTGIGGALFAQLTRFTSPQLGSWYMSGELIILVLLGGGKTRSGLFLAAVAVVGIQEGVARYTDHWPLVLGALVLARVLWPENLGALKKAATPGEQGKAS